MKMKLDSNIKQATELVRQTLDTDRQAPIVKGFFHEPTYTASYVVHDPATNRGAIIDSVLDFDQPSGRTSTESADQIANYVRDAEIEIDYILETHAHADHLSAAPYLQDELGGKIGIGREILTVQEVFGKVFNEGTGFARDGSQFDHLIEDGEVFTLGKLQIAALHVPGHTPADMAYIIGDALFVGDTMFMPDYGTARADFPGGDARTLFRSIRRLMEFPDETRVFLCHDYKAPGRDQFVWETTIGAQRSANVHAHDGVSEDEFVAMRTARDKTLGMPRLILPSIQVNMRAGHLPEPESNGTRYLKLPLNSF
ncbi:MBL fold metallo-hydrolase [Altererythrobacter sp. JGD-16]|uniref:MBL fold metallo-hydrolase n=2 Tax=Altererythrobacter lutimaris TaxID=2743979 RepID=A0A850HE98_9SPHN|nr:MBL fold metallo-hydrolase [Altererythrobacter lutimaris]